MSYASKLKKSLFQCIETLNQRRNEYCHSPGKDYTRNRKADFSSIIKAVLCLGGKSLNKELYEIFGFSPDTLTPSAFIQQRSKIKPEAFEELFRSFNRANQQIQLFHGYRLLAIDGSLLHTPTNKMDTDSLHYNRTSCFNLYNVNALYDLNSHTYTDVLIQKFKQRNEHSAFVKLVDDLDSSVPALITADRGYESYNNLAHVQESGHKFLIRMKDKNSNGILQRFKLSDGEFDLPIHLTLTRKQTNDLKSDPSVICIGNSRKLDFLPYSYKKTDPTVFYSLDFRIVRVKISDDCYDRNFFQKAEIHRRSDGASFQKIRAYPSRDFCEAHYVQLLRISYFPHSYPKKEKKTPLQDQLFYRCSRVPQSSAWQICS